MKQVIRESDADYIISKVSKLDLNYSLFKSNDDLESDDDSDVSGSTENDGSGSSDESVSSAKHSTYRKTTRIMHSSSYSDSSEPETAPTKSNAEFEENVTVTIFDKIQMDLRHLELNRGASKGISMTPSAVVKTIEFEKSNLNEKIVNFVDDYLNIVRLNPYKIKEFLEAKYFRLFSKHIKYQ